VCFRSAPRILLDEALRVLEPGVPGHIVVEVEAAAGAAKSNRRCHADDAA
jgi:hypothetical protein